MGRTSKTFKFPMCLERIGIAMVMPLNILEKTMNKRVALLLKDNRVIEGKLVGYDEYMNMVLEDTEENNQGSVRKLGTIILRGNNIVTIMPKSE